MTGTLPGDCSGGCQVQTRTTHEREDRAMGHTLYAVRVTHTNGDVTEWWGRTDAGLRADLGASGTLGEVVPFTWAGTPTGDDDAVMLAASAALHAAHGAIPPGTWRAKKKEAGQVWIAGMTRAQWDRGTREYVAGREAILAAGGSLAHEGCDHAYGICAEGTR